MGWCNGDGYGTEGLDQSAGNYLRGTRLFLACCGKGQAPERSQLRRVCRHANALVHTALVPQLKYVVVSYYT